MIPWLNWWEGLLIILVGQFVWSFFRAWHEEVYGDGKLTASQLAKEGWEIADWRWCWHRLSGRLVVRLSDGTEGIVKVNALS